MSEGEKGKSLEKIRIDSLIVNPKIRREILLGDIDSLIKISKKTNQIEGIIWNEESITLLTQDPSITIQFKPEFLPTTRVFFRRDDSRRGGGYGESPINVWEGEYEPVKFTKANLAKFLRSTIKSDNSELMKAITKFKIRESTARTETMIDMSDDSYDSQEKVRAETNIPKMFTLELPIIEKLSAGREITASLDFEASVETMKDSYGSEDKKGRKVILLRCLNSRVVMRNVMEGFLKELPENIPRYYGKLGVEKESKY